MGSRGPGNPVHLTHCVHSSNCMVQYTVVSLPALEARMACAAIFKNAVASSSHQTLDLHKAPLLECIQTPTLADYAEHAAHKKAWKKKT